MFLTAATALWIVLQIQLLNPLVPEFMDAISNQLYVSI